MNDPINEIAQLSLTKLSLDACRMSGGEISKVVELSPALIGRKIYSVIVVLQTSRHIFT
jgi:hypothetical protein